MVKQRLCLIATTVFITITLPVLTGHQDLFQDRAISNPEGSPIGGTLAIAMPAQKGIVICADKRIRPEGVKKPDSTTKIFQVERSLAFAHTGTLGFVDANTKNFLYQPTEVAKQFLVQNPFQNNDNYWLSLCNELVRSFEKYLSRIPYEYWPETDPSPDNTMFQLLFFFVESKEAKISCIKFKYIKRPSDPIRQAFKFDATTASLKIAKPIPFGNSMIFEQISAKDRKAVIKNSDEGQIQHFMHDGVPRESTTVKRAVSIAKKIIEITSERLEEMGPPQNDVSPNCDCALISPDAGFIWLDKVKTKH